MKYVTPSTKETAFNCPYCQTFAHQNWFFIGAAPMSRPPATIDELVEAVSGEKVRDPRLFNSDVSASNTRIGYANASKCARCDKVTIWVNGEIAYPKTGHAPEANPDMPDDIRRDYDEASSILDNSPRGAAALVRLAIQKLCKVLDQSGENINKDIGALVKGGLDSRVQQSLDVVRVIGNQAVHPGQIDLRDDRKTAGLLFELLNLVVDKMISEPQKVAEVYASLPEGAIKAIEKRDRKE